MHDVFNHVHPFYFAYEQKLKWRLEKGTQAKFPFEEKFNSFLYALIVLLVIIVIITLIVNTIKI